MARHAGKVVAFEVNPMVAQFARTVAPRNVEIVNVALSSAPRLARRSRSRAIQKAARSKSLLRLNPAIRCIQAMQ
jgi:hypothetical protein